MPLHPLLAVAALASLVAFAAPALAGGRAGDFDFYVLSLSWTPAACASGEADDEECDAPHSFLVHGFWPDTISSVVPGGWSVADEAIFYALFPFLVPVLLKSSWRTILIVLAVALVGGAQASRVLDAFVSQWLPESAATVTHFYFFYWFPRQLPCFILGIMLFKWQSERPLPAPGVAAPLCILSIALMIAVPFLEGVKYALPLGPQTTYGLVFALFVCALMSWKSSPLVNPVMVWIGKVSYSAYFIHFAVLYYLAVPRLTGNVVVDFAAFYAVTVAITIALSSATYRLVEQPLIKFGSGVISRRMVEA